MSHRIVTALFRTPLSRLLRRRGHDAGRVQPPAAVPGIGFGSCGIPRECMVIIRGKAS
ncbi:hypothetical protein ACFYNL_10685 [Streptomyces sp. NPDC007808]|uniref:hypothetical protein n=1 Tax=Streptomyces sp. NPDC007808 TaxID=3364779 RepID=UPI00367B782D